MNSTLTHIQSLVASLAEKIEAPPHLLPTYGYSEDGARPHIEAGENGSLYYVVVERGQELRRDAATDTDYLLYCIFADVTFAMACRFEGKYRKEGEDFRRQLFAHQEALLGVLNEEWKLRMQKEHEAILQQHPFDDNS